MQNEPTDVGKIDAARVEESNEIDAEWDGGRSKHDAERADGSSTVVRSTMKSTCESRVDEKTPSSRR